MNVIVCNVCGDDFQVSVPAATVFIPGKGNFSCGFLDVAGKAGNITKEDCPFLPQFMVPCGCPGPAPPPPDLAPWLPLPTNTSSQCVCPSIPTSFAPSVFPNMPSVPLNIGNGGNGYDEDTDGGHNGVSGKSGKGVDEDMKVCQARVEKDSMMILMVNMKACRARVENEVKKKEF
jgi:hypothetical protein